MARSSKHIFIAILKKYKGLEVAILITAAFLTLTEMLSPLLFREFLAVFLDENPIFFQSKESIIICSVILLATRSVFNAVTGYIGALLAYESYTNIAIHLYKHVQFLNPLRFDSKEKGNVSSLFTTDMKNIIPLFQITLPDLLDNFLLLFFSAVVLGCLNIKLTVLLLAPYFLVFYIFKSYSATVQNLTNISISSMVKINQNILFILHKLKLTYIYDKYATEESAIKKSIKDYRDRMIEIEFRINANSIPINFLNNLSLILVIIYGTFLLNHQMLSLPDFTAFLLYSKFMSGPMINLIKRLDMSRSSFSSLSRINHALNEPLFFTHKDDAKIPDNIDRVSVHQVCFGYDAISKVLNNVSMNMEKGKITLICGSSGSGKTTIMNLLVGLLDLKSSDKGQISLAGIHYNVLSRQTIASAFGYVTQRPILDDGTLLDNVMYYNPDGDRNFAEKCLRLAHIEGDLLSPDLKIKSDGDTLSIGQQQRVSIARAVFKGAPFLLLDEPLASLDNHSKKIIKKSLVDIRKSGVGIILITHNLLLADIADNIYLLEKGTIVEEGNFDCLLNQRGKFFDYYQKGSL